MVFYRLPSNISKRPKKHPEGLGASGVGDTEGADSPARGRRCTGLELVESFHSKIGEGFMSGCASASQEPDQIVAWVGSVAEVGIRADCRNGGLGTAFGGADKEA